MAHFRHNHLSDYDAVPMEYRAQINHRCSRQYPNSGHASQWVKEWLQASASKPRCSDQPENPLFRTLEVQIDWRLVSNSGTDEGIIRPVIAAGGWPLIPGSSIKGLFRRACQRLHPDQLARWCGSPPESGNSAAGSHGILRFHGAWPTDEKWKERLLDIVHGQQRWQIWDPDSYQTVNGREWKQKISHNANAIISLYQPTLIVPVSTSAADLAEHEWTQIQSTLHAALSLGIGGRTCAGYGSIAHSGGSAAPIGMPVIFQCGLEGQGVASTLLSKDQAEFRPNMFRAALRGMTLRLFGGLCGNEAARKQTGWLFGSTDRNDGGQQRGLLESRFTNYEVAIKEWSSDQAVSHVFATTGTLQWQLTRDNLPDDQLELLTDLLAALHGITYCLAGFGRSWRRPDHRIFYPGYYSIYPKKAAIGCHWQLRDADVLKDHPEWAVSSAEMLSELLGNARSLAFAWLSIRKVHCNPARIHTLSSWREVIHPEFMRVWIRRAESSTDAEAIHWFHKHPTLNQDDLRNPHGLKGSSIAGHVGQQAPHSPEIEVSRIWNRMLPCVTSDSLPSWLEKSESGLNRQAVSITPWPGEYREIVVLYADRHGIDPDPGHQAALISSMDANDSPFERVVISML